MALILTAKDIVMLVVRQKPGLEKDDVYDARRGDHLEAILDPDARADRPARAVPRGEAVVVALNHHGFSH
jgi:hypothetical protein